MIRRLKHNGRSYINVGSEPYERRDGTRTELLLWQGQCVYCDQSFMHKSPSVPDASKLPSRCHEHRQCRGTSNSISSALIEPNLLKIQNWFGDSAPVDTSTLTSEQRKALNGPIEFHNDWIVHSDDAGIYSTLYCHYDRSVLAAASRLVSMFSVPDKTERAIYSALGTAENLAFFFSPSTRLMNDAEQRLFSLYAAAVRTEFSRTMNLRASPQEFRYEMTSRLELRSGDTPESLRLRFSPLVEMILWRMEGFEQPEDYELLFWDHSGWVVLEAGLLTGFIPSFSMLAFDEGRREDAFCVEMSRVGNDGRIDKIRLSDIPDSEAPRKELLTFARAYPGYLGGRSSRGSSDSLRVAELTLAAPGEATVDDLRAALFLLMRDDASFDHWSPDRSTECQELVRELRRRFE